MATNYDPAIEKIIEKDVAEDQVWSPDVAQVLEQLSKTHFVDVYNRSLIIRHLLSEFSHEQLKDKNYLDIGCGVGYLLSDIFDKTPLTRVYATDTHQPSLQKITEKFGASVKMLNLDLNSGAQDLDLGGLNFNIITCLNVLEHIKNDSHAVMRMSELLQPNGELLITVPAGPGLFDFQDRIYGHYRRYSLDALIRVGAQNGLRVIYANYFLAFPYPVFWFIKKLSLFRNKIGLKEEVRVRHTLNAMKKSSASGFVQFFLLKMCYLESVLGKYMTFPFGVRAVVILRKVA